MTGSSTPRALFLWELSAGHIANLRRTKPMFEAHPDIDAVVVGVRNWDEGGRLERMGLGAISSRLRPSIEFRQHLRAEDWDAVYVSSVGLRGNVKAVSRFPNVLDTDATPGQMAAMPEYDMERFGPDSFREFYDRRMARSATMISAWSQWAADGHVDLGIDADRIAVNPPGVDLDLWHPGDATPPSASDDVIRIVFVGGDFERKGGADLLAWFRSQDDPRFELHLVTPADVEAGDGVTVHRLSEADPAMQELIRSAHVSVLPSRAECFGIASIEALACGVPVIQSTVGGSADIVTDGETGLLVPPGRPDEIGQAIRSIVADDGRYAAMRVAARTDAEQRFGLQRNVDHTVELLLESIERHARERADR